MKVSVVLFCLLTVVSSGYALAQEEPGPEAAAMLAKVAALDQQGKIEDAFRLLDQGLEKYKEANYDRFFTLNYKFILLSRLKRYEEAVKICEEKANIIPSPKQALSVAETYLKINDRDKALDWIRKSVERGLQSYAVFNTDIYEPLRGKASFAALVETVKRRNGLGLPAPLFRRESLSGKPITLEDYRGKVVLLDFWATFCPPCLQEMPHLKKCYEEYRARGFEIVGFSEDQDQGRLAAYLKENGIAWENIFCPQGDADETVRLYKVVNIPASFLIDRNGILRQVNLSGRNLENAIEELLGKGEAPAKDPVHPTGESESPEKPGRE